MPRDVTTAPPVLLDRSAFVNLVEQARRAAAGGSSAGELAQAVLALEAERHRQEWDDADASVPMGLYVGDERGYFLLRDVPPEARNRPGQPPLKEFWRGDDAEITVIDQVPISARCMTRLERLGIATLRPELPRFYANAPFRFLSVSDPKWGSSRNSSWAVEKAIGTPGGAWIVDLANDRRLAWVASEWDAEYIASAVNMTFTLEVEVLQRHGSLEFTKQVKESGLVGLIRLLRRSIEPQERWEREPAEALRAAGAELQERVAAFMAEARGKSS